MKFIWIPNPVRPPWVKGPRPWVVVAKIVDDKPAAAKIVDDKPAAAAEQ